MSSNEKKFPVEFTFTEDPNSESKRRDFTLNIKVSDGDLVENYVLKGTDHQKYEKVVGLYSFTSDKHEFENIHLTVYFQALILRITSLYLGRSLDTFFLANGLYPGIFGEAVGYTRDKERKVPGVKTAEVLDLKDTAAELFAVTCKDLFPIMTHDPELVAFEESWLDFSTGMMLNAVFEIPESWKSNVNAAGVVKRDDGAQWVWNWSPMTDMLIISAHDADRKRSQWEVTKEGAIQMFGGDRENATHYRCFLNVDKQRIWIKTRETVIQRTFVDALPAATTKGVFAQIKHLLIQMRNITTQRDKSGRHTFNFDTWLTTAALTEVWKVNGKLPVDTPDFIGAQYQHLLKLHAIYVHGTYNNDPYIANPGRDLLLAFYEFLKPTYDPRQPKPDYIQHFLDSAKAEVDKIQIVLDDKVGDGQKDFYDKVSLSNEQTVIKQFIKHVQEREDDFYVD